MRLQEENEIKTPTEMEPYYDEINFARVKFSKGASRKRRAIPYIVSYKIYSSSCNQVVHELIDLIHLIMHLCQSK